MITLIEVDVGDAVVIRGTLTDEAGDPVTGAAVSARALAPGAAESSLGAATEEGTSGVYRVSLAITLPGRYEVRMESEEPNMAAAEGAVYARATRFA